MTSGRIRLYRDIFAWLKTMPGKQNLASVLGIQKWKIGDNHVFFRDKKLQFGNKRHTLLCILPFLRIIVA